MSRWCHVGEKCGSRPRDIKWSAVSSFGGQAPSIADAVRHHADGASRKTYRAALHVSDDNEIEPCVARRLAGRPGAPCEAPAVLNGLRQRHAACRRSSDDWRATRQRSDLAPRGRNTGRSEDEPHSPRCRVLRWRRVDARVAVSEDLLEIAQQQPFDDIRHDLGARLGGLRGQYRIIGIALRAAHNRLVGGSSPPGHHVLSV